MARPPAFAAEEKVRIVLSILAGEVTVAEAAWWCYRWDTRPRSPRIR